MLQTIKNNAGIFVFINCTFTGIALGKSIFFSPPFIQPTTTEIAQTLVNKCSNFSNQPY